MALINRVSRLFKADLHAVLDQIEEPEQLLKQAIRDMEEELEAAGRRLASDLYDAESFEARRREIVASMTDVDGQLDLCFASGKDELTRGLIRKKLEAERIAKRLDSRIESKQAALAEQRSLIRQNRQTLDGLRQKAELFAHRPGYAGVAEGTGDDGWLARELLVSDDEVEIAYLREKAQRSGS